jgi:hypothetical protein
VCVCVRACVRVRARVRARIDGVPEVQLTGCGQAERAWTSAGQRGGRCGMAAARQVWDGGRGGWITARGDAWGKGVCKGCV